MISWEEYKNMNLPQYLFTDLQPTDILCPECGKKVYKRMNIVLTSYPPQYQYECECGWVGYAYQ